MSGTLDIVDVKGKRVTVMGLGRFGGGVSAVRFLVERGARVTVTDLLSETELADSLSELDGVPLEGVHLGGHQERDFQSADLVVVSPAVPRDSCYLELARQSGVPLTSEMNLFWQHNCGRVIGVTGSNGKSTTAAILHSILAATGFRCWLGGNIGRSLLPVVDQIASDDWVVLELSSFHLNDLDRLFTSPQIAVVTNFSPNHLDWHHSLDEYRRSKQTILRWQLDQHTAVLNQDDPDVAHWPSNGRRLYFGTQDLGRHGIFACGAGFPATCGAGFPATCGAGFPACHDESAGWEACPTASGGSSEEHVVFRDQRGEQILALSEWLTLPGRHNLQNALAAVCTALALGAGPSAVHRGLKSFVPLPHRLEKVAEVAGRTFYNDSLATTPESASIALEAFTAPVVLLAGGYDKQLDLSDFAQAIAKKSKAVALMGQTAEPLAFLIEKNARQRTIPCQESPSLEAAFNWAVDQSAPGDVVLLSPGCASYDWFNNFAERGERFTELVRAWESEPR